ncbi:MAG: hypothetical protein R3Y04_09645, partial [Rikenellaceae bacterium]
MRKVACVNHSTLIRFTALFMLSVMVTLLVGSSVHTYIHSTHLTSSMRHPKHLIKELFDFFM